MEEELIARRCAKRVIDCLQSRKGFNDFFREAHVAIRKEITAAIKAELHLKRVEEEKKRKLAAACREGSKLIREDGK